jgi:hypothetical protein
MTGMLAPPVQQYTIPSLTVNPTQLTGRGLCTISYAQDSLTFRTNPNEITWDYELITHIEETYGGRVVQILGVKMDNLVIKVDCGQGGWPYAMRVIGFMRDLMVNQRNGNSPATLTYTTRNWNMKVFALNVPFMDSVTETVRELELNFNIQEDIAGTNISQSISDALMALQNSIGWTPNVFNNSAPSLLNTVSDPNANNGVSTVTPTATPASALISGVSSASSGIPGLSNILQGVGIG